MTTGVGASVDRQVALDRAAHGREPLQLDPMAAVGHRHLEVKIQDNYALISELGRYAGRRAIIDRSLDFVYSGAAHRRC